MNTLFVLLLAATSPAFAARAMTDCDAYEGPEQVTCLQEKYPNISGRVETKCAADPDKVRACRIEAYAAEGIVFHPATHRQSSSTRTSTATASAPAAADLRSAATGAASSAAASAVAKTGVATTSSFQLDAKAVRTASVGLTTAGTAMSIGINMCGAACKLSDADKAAISTFGGVIATQGPKIGMVLGTNRTDLQKANDLVILTQEIIAAAPSIKDQKARGYVQAAVAAAQGVLAVVTPE